MSYQIEGAAKANVFCLRIAASICDSCDCLINKRGELLGSVMATKSSTMPVGVGGDADDTGLVESDRQSEGVSGLKEGDMYAGCRLGEWIWGGEGVGFGGEVCPGPKEEIGEVKWLRATMGRELAVEEADLKMVGRA